MADRDILLGPILGYEWDSTEKKSFYTVLVRTSKGTAPKWNVDGVPVKMKELYAVAHDGSKVWRGEVEMLPFTADAPRKIRYSIERGTKALRNICGDSQWAFNLPAKVSPDQTPRIAFCSCNGFTDPNSMRGLNPLAMWERMEQMHQDEPLSLLLMGGDQIYCDDLARKEGSFARLFSWLKPEEQPKAKPTGGDFIKTYIDHYLLAWAGITVEGKTYPHTPLVRMLASVPSIMVWDDHDIFDGWGSYQSSEQKTPYHKEAFGAAREAFELYQIRGHSSNRSLLDRTSKRPRHYSSGVRFGNFNILVMDNRTNRTPDRVMDEVQWKQIVNWLQQEAMSVPTGTSSTLLVVSPVPVIYRRFFDWVSSLPGEHGGEDDLRDHWSHHTHEGERDRLISHLFEALNFNQKPNGFNRISIISGDVHVGALGFLERTDTRAEIAQIISSAIIHPAPGAVAWAGLKALSSDDDHAVKGQPVVAKMTRPVGAKDRYLRCRNFVWLQEGNDNRLWVNWECEALDQKDPKRVEFGLR